MIRDNTSGKTVNANDIVEEKLRELGCCDLCYSRYEVGHFAETVDNDENSIVVIRGGEGCN